MKKMFAILMVVMMSVSCFVVPAGAVEIKNVPDAEGNFSFNVGVNDLNNCEALDFEDVIAQDMEHYNISYETARKRLLDGEAEMLAEYYGKMATPANAFLQSTHSDLIEYYTFEKPFTYDNNPAFKGLMQARIAVLNDYGVHKVIQKVNWILTRATAGLHAYSWVDGPTTNEISADKKSVRIEIVGYFEVRSTVAIELPGFVSGGVSISDDLIYQSETVIRNWNYSVS